MFKADAQDYTNPKVLGDKAFRDKNYYEAAFYYKKAADGLNLLKQTETPYSGSNKSKKIAPVDRAYICYMLAESYRLYENYLEAEGWYYNVLNENFEAKYPLARLWYGVCLRANQHFDESISQLQDFIAAYKGDSNNIAIARKEIQTCNFAKEQYQYPLFLDIVKLRGAWNSDGSDYSIIKRDQNYWYTSSRIIKGDKKHLNRIYAALASDNFKPQIINFKQDTKAVDLEYGTPSLDPAGKRMYLTRWYKEGAKSVRGIYKSEWQNGEWAMPVKLNANVNAEGFNSIQPFITADGKHLYFSSNKPGGQGGDDIWMSDLDNEGNPISSVNLGKAINSPFDEEAPYYDEGEKKLIYSSKGFLGLGGFDFYESFEKAGRWQQSQNMGYPMNSAKDDLYYYPDNNDPNKFYISSDRESECCLELFEVHDRRHILTGLVVDCNTHKALAGVKVSLVDSITKQTLRTEVLDQRGKYNFAITTKRPHNLVFEKPEYFTKVIQAPTSGKISNDTLYNAEVCLQAFVVNKPIVLENILYDFNKATLRPESKEVLNKLVTILKDNPAIKIELASHTDSIGSDAYNNNLSQQRAQACVDYIIASGITDTRIFARGYGKTKPVAPNSTPDGKDNPDGRQLNRRTEFTVLKTE
jgi:outer membrane protein OmpA-like peptidoglycan-associated protein